MTSWQNFEIECTEYLNEHFGRFAFFEHQGGSDSKYSDIKVETNNNKNFYMEAKQCPAQCGQFVLFPNLATQTFEYSSSNATVMDEFSSLIVSFMNEHFANFYEAGTAGKAIKFENCFEVFSKWIVKYYKQKGVKFFISNNHIIFPIEQFSQFFRVKAKYRIKRSGSSSVGSNQFNKLKEFVTRSNWEITATENRNGKMFVFSNIQLHNVRFILDGIEYMFSKRDDVYEVRRLSKTFNANVIFSIELKENKPNGLSFDEFVAFLAD